MKKKKKETILQIKSSIFPKQITFFNLAEIQMK